MAVVRFVRELTDAVSLDTAVLDTPLGRIIGGTRDAVSRTFGTIAKWFVYGVAILAAPNLLAIDALSEWVGTAVSYLRAFVAGLGVIILGFVVADFIGDAIMWTRAATLTGYTSWFATGTQMFLYFTAIVIASRRWASTSVSSTCARERSRAVSPRPSPLASASLSAMMATRTSPRTSTAGW